MPLKKLNDLSVIPLRARGSGSKPKGWKMFPRKYCNVFLVARKAQGKTSAILQILKECATKGETEVYAFVSTLYNDDAWATIKNWCLDNGIAFGGFTEISSGKQNHLIELMKTFQTPDPSPAPKKESYVGGSHPIIRFDEPLVSKPSLGKGKPLPASDAVERIFIFDDLGDQIKNPALAELLKRNRHLHSKVLVSSQYVKDLRPASRQNIDYWLLFPMLNSDTLDVVYKDSMVPVDYDKFEKVYKLATATPHSFLYVDTRAQPDKAFRVNFSHLLEL